jgi:transcriptional regulator with XRE-family HTH domain
MDRVELARFLRARREALQPDQVGLAPGIRRRTPGLRREEVALLAGMSPDYYSRLEQQRAPQPSEQLVQAIARALLLDADARDHLLRLTGHQAPPRPTVSVDVNAATLRILERLHDTAAQVTTDLGEIPAQNRMAKALLGDHTGYTGLARSFTWRWFTDPPTRRLYPEDDHDYQSRIQVADLRAAVGMRGDDPYALNLVASLMETSSEFAELWERHEVALRHTDHKTIVHPIEGPIEVDCQTFIAESQTQRLLVFTAPPGSPAETQLERIRARLVDDVDVDVDAGEKLHA